MRRRRLAPAGASVCVLAPIWLACAAGGQGDTSGIDDASVTDGSGDAPHDAPHDSPPYDASRDTRGGDTGNDTGTDTGVDTGSDAGDDSSGDAGCNASCTGCCAGSTCISNVTDTQCGSGGAACQDCTASGGVCQNGLCVSVPPDAGPDAKDGGGGGDGSVNCANTCAGCCDTNNVCQPGNTNTMCGTFPPGQPCQDCTKNSGICFLDVWFYVCL